LIGADRNFAVLKFNGTRRGLSNEVWLHNFCDLCIAYALLHDAHWPSHCRLVPAAAQQWHLRMRSLQCIRYRAPCRVCPKAPCRNWGERECSSLPLLCPYLALSRALRGGCHDTCMTPPGGNARICNERIPSKYNKVPRILGMFIYQCAKLR